MVLRGAGRIKLAMGQMAFGSITNIILDPIFIVLLKPYGLGVEAVAIATILSHALGAIVTFIILLRERQVSSSGGRSFQKS